MDEAGHASTDKRSFNPLGCNKEITMKKLSFIAYPALVALSMLAAVAAHAENPSIDTSAQQKSTQTRAQVQAELAQARADGTLQLAHSEYAPVALTESERSRAEVRAEAVAANRAHFGHDWYGEDSGSIVMAQQTRTLPVAALFAGLRQRAR